jgi:ankyrin repeat protein
MSTGETPLMVAAAKGYSDMVELLLDQGADVDAEARSRSRHGNALEAASRMGHKQVVKLLLDNMAYINAKSDYCGTALGVASIKGYDQIVELLLSNGANVNAPGIFGLALSCAVSGGYAEIVALLIHNGADVNARNYSNIETDNPLWIALSRRRIKIAKLLLSHGAIALLNPEESRRRAAIAAPSKPKGRHSTSVETRRAPASTQPAPRRMSLSEAGSATRAGQKRGRPGAAGFDIPPYYGTGRTRNGRATIASTAWPSLTPASSRRLVLLLLLLALVLLLLLIIWLSR